MKISLFFQLYLAHYECFPSVGRWNFNRADFTRTLMQMELHGVLRGVFNADVYIVFSRDTFFHSLFPPFSGGDIAYVERAAFQIVRYVDIHTVFRAIGSAFVFYVIVVIRLLFGPFVIVFGF